MKRTIITLLALSLALFASAQTTNENKPQEVIVRVQTEQPKHVEEKPMVQKANEWVDFGKNVGTAFDAGLTSLTDHTEKFSKTDAGRFTMAIIAWKVAGKDAFDMTKYVTDKLVHLVIGIPMLIVWIGLAYFFIKREFVQHRVVTKKSGPFWNRTYEYKLVNDEGFGDGRTAGYFISCIVAVIGISSIIGFIVS